ncbi:hypothetical protein phi3396_52 [Streptococcus phage phi3396]|uniref:hypothetical protein n=1 Tax=Streptococcus phage phi3396 TaxID=423476 RepID=UPI0000F0E8DC|nr:hypothetical protein phi3396_52 [Streptococcus phage phi3396]ABN10825.1 hypothetical protein phi3396_52 [Streptococcus phage phi3396]
MLSSNCSKMLSIKTISSDVNSSSDSAKYSKKSINRLEYSPPFITIGSLANSSKKSLSSASFDVSSILGLPLSSVIHLPSSFLETYWSIISTSSLAYSLSLASTFASSLARPRLARIFVTLILSSTLCSVFKSLFLMVNCMLSPILKKFVWLYILRSL